MAKTKIEWADATWNPVTGCSPCSEGCQNCYARRMAKRLQAMGQKKYRHGFAVRFHREVLDEPLKWKKPRIVFPCSMSDLFHPSVEAEWQTDVWKAMAASQWHRFMVLTKRPKIMAEAVETIGSVKKRNEWFALLEYSRSKYPNDPVAVKVQWPLPNVHLGVTVCNQKEADEKIPILLQIPAADRFVSIEPMLGPVDLTKLNIKLPSEIPDHHYTEVDSLDTEGGGFQHDTPYSKPLDLVILGGESGPGARFCDPEWIRSIVQQCQSANVKCFVKQIHIKTNKGFRLSKDMSEWPEELRVRELGG